MINHYSHATKILNAHGYNAIANIKTHGITDRELLDLKVEVSPFSIHHHTQRIKLLLPDFDVQSLGSNSGMGRISIRKK
jgi:hypothetical protein